MVYHLSTMVGCVNTRLSMRALARQLSTASLRVAVKKRTYCNGEYYIRIYAGNDFTLERMVSDSYRAEGISTSVDRMYAVAVRVSSRLTKINVKHRFVVLDEHSRLDHYLHHLWPQAVEAPLEPKPLSKSNPDES
jgi:hypothetical protein